MSWRHLRFSILLDIVEAQHLGRSNSRLGLPLNYRVNWTVPVDRRPLVDRTRVGKRYRCHCGFQSNSRNGFRKHVHRPRARCAGSEQKPQFWTGEPSQVEALKQSGWL